MFHCFRGTTQTGFVYLVAVDHPMAGLFKRRAAMSRKSFDVWDEKYPKLSDFLIAPINRPFRVCIVLSASDFNDQTLERLLLSSRITPDGEWWLPIPSGLKRCKTT